MDIDYLHIGRHSSKVRKLDCAWLVELIVDVNIFSYRHDKYMTKLGKHLDFVLFEGFTRNDLYHGYLKECACTLDAKLLFVTGRS